PLATIASAVSLTSCSLTSQPKWFQLFQPIGGVRARPCSAPWTAELALGMESEKRSGAISRDVNGGRTGGSRSGGPSVREWTVVDVQHGQSLEMCDEPPGEVAVIPLFRRCPQHLGEGAHPGKHHVLRSLRVGDVFGPQLSLSPEHMSPRARESASVRAGSPATGSSAPRRRRYGSSVPGTTPSLPSARSDRSGRSRLRD